jgi:hypothetical protein
MSTSIFSKFHPVHLEFLCSLLVFVLLTTMHLMQQYSSRLDLSLDALGLLKINGLLTWQNVAN